MILVDPKVVELQCYNGIPHLLIPVVSDPHKASGALAWAVGEMMDRYNKFQEKGVRAIDGYNEALDEDEEPMPRIVIVIDELADLMMTCKKEVEERICRLAQLARAAGIHLVVATQRPSVDVITGLIKANIPSRIAFKVSSNVDSRTILDRNGAEQLLGYGDMLYMPMGEFTPIRVQGCFLTDDEVNGITDFIRQYRRRTTTAACWMNSTAWRTWATTATRMTRMRIRRWTNTPPLTATSSRSAWKWRCATVKSRRA